MSRAGASRHAKVVLVVAILLTIAASSATRQPIVSTLGTATAEAETGGRLPIDTPVQTTTQASAPTLAPPSSGGIMDADLLKWGVTQGGLTIALLIVLWSYKRTLEAQTKAETDRAEAEREDKAEIAAVLRESSAALTTSAVTAARQTDAMHRLSRCVENLEKKFT